MIQRYFQKLHKMKFKGKLILAQRVCKICAVLSRYAFAMNFWTTPHSKGWNQKAGLFLVLPFFKVPQTTKSELQKPLIPLPLHLAQFPGSKTWALKF